MRIFLAVLLVVMLAVPARAGTGDSDAILFKGRHLVALNVGVLTDVGSNASVSMGNGVSVKSEGSGFLGGVRYSYWFAEDLALDLGVGVMDTDASVMVNGTDQATEAATVTRVIIGVRYEPLKMAMARNVRPYVVGSLASYSGNVSSVWTGTTMTAVGSYSDTSMGGRLGIGLDILVGNWFAVGAEAGYGFVNDFDRQIGGEVNYSSPEILISLGVSLGVTR